MGLLRGKEILLYSGLYSMEVVSYIALCIAITLITQQQIMS